jgi:ribonuclease J
VTLRIVPLGGLGEVGMNCMVLEEGDRALVVDCGVLFPDDEAPGVDVIHPSFEYLREGPARVEALVITHGHEDHIGAVPYFLRQFDVPVFGPPLALALVRERLREHSLRFEPRFVETRPGVRFDAGPFTVEPIRVTHSIPDATALCIEGPTGRLLHSGDFKIDRTPVDGLEFDEARIRALAEDGDGVGLLLSDSTNAEVPGEAGSESDVRRSLERIIGEAPAAVLVAFFSSNVHRLQILFDAARAFDRKVVLLGRSVRTHERIGGELGLLSRRGVPIVTPEEAVLLPRNKVLGLVSGAQGEPGAALGRLASGEMRPFTLERGDTVILSSRVIPGNERPVQRILDALARRGAIVVHRGLEPSVHVSGHAQSGEQRALLEMARPRSFVPIHGTRTFLERHAALARAAGVPSSLVVEDGHSVVWDGREVGHDGKVPAGRVHIDGAPIGPEALRDRRALAQSGIAFVAVAWAEDGRLAPVVALRGLVELAELEELETDGARAVADAIEELPPLRRHDPADVRDTARMAIRRFLRKELGRMPQAVAVVVEARR